MLYLQDEVQPRFRLWEKSGYITIQNDNQCLNPVCHDDMTAKEFYKKTQRLFQHSLILSKLQSNNIVLLQMVSTSLRKLILQWDFV